jgi:hypothetical protein
MLRRVFRVGAVLALLSVGGVAAAAPASDGTNPLELYPRRPGAKYTDIEARPGTPVTITAFSDLEGSGASGLDGTLELVGWSVVGSASLPRDLLERGRRVGPAPEGFAPRPKLSGDMLSLTVRQTALSYDLFGSKSPLETPDCTVTAASDGALLVPAIARTPPRTTTTNRVYQSVVVARLYVAIGARRGRFYVACRLGGIIAYASETRAVWGIDV